MALWLLIAGCVRVAPGDLMVSVAGPLLNGDPLDVTVDGAVSSWTLSDGARTEWVDPDEAIAWPRPAVLTLSAHDPPGVVRARTEVLALGREVMWGDLHAHSNLSHDGCEVVDEDCADRGSVAAEDFFERARDADLDFTALTDHAEYASYHADGDPTSEGVDIWTEQQQRVQEAEADDFVPLLGYEWTLAKDHELDDQGHWEGGHKTVVLGETAACDDYRVPAPHLEFDYAKGAGTTGVSVPREDEGVGSAAALYERLRAARASCGDQEVVAFAHHPAWSVPQATDFSSALYDPDPDFERLVEIASEHGDSECYDPTDEACGWWPKAGVDYRPAGSVQSALREGFHVGFVGGTDSHDASPGSLDDPSCTAKFEDTDGDGSPDTPMCHGWGGTLTGVLVDAFGREPLFRGLDARSTLVTSGPRVTPRAALVADGHLYLPGEAVPVGAVRIAAWVPEHGADWTVMELVDPLGTVRASSDGLRLDVEVELTDSDDALYLRIRTEVEGVEHRLWASPWFGQATSDQR